MIWGTCDNLQKIATAQGDDYTTGCIIDYSCFKEIYKIIEIDLSKHQSLDADPKGIQQINFFGNLGQAKQTTMFFINEEAKEIILNFS